ncbi:hypothetical protein ACWD48_10120 [Streptomyces sp. NPDC002519]
MSTTRRGVLGAAMSAPLLARFTQTATAASTPATWGTFSDGWVEVRWTPQAQTQLDRFGAVVEAIAPAQLIKDARGSAVRFPLRSGAGDPSLASLPDAQGTGLLGGGLAVRTATGRFQVTSLESVLHNGQASGTCVVNGADLGHRSVFRCGLAEGRLLADPVPPGRPLPLRLRDLPLRPTSESLEAFATAFGASGFTLGTVLAYVSAEGVYTPPPKQ